MRPRTGKIQKEHNSREARSPGVSLPSSLVEELTANEPSASNNGGPGHSFTTTTRKQARKQKRLLKKQSISNAQKEWKTRRETRTTESSTLNSVVKQKRQKRPPIRSDQKDETEQNSNEQLDNSVRNDVTEPNARQRKALKRKRSNPENSVEEKGSANLESDDPDARKAKELEALLGIDRKRRKRESEGRSFSYADVFGEGEDDLVDLLNFCDGVQSKAKSSLPKAAAVGSPASEEDPSDDVHSQHDVSSSDGFQESGSDDVVSADPDSGSDDGDNGEESVSSEGVDEDGHEGDEIEPIHNHTISRPSGRTIGGESEKAGCTITGSSPVGGISRSNHSAERDRDSNAGPSTRDSSIRKVGKYVPPSARKQDERMTGGMKRRLRGLLNRVADINASGIADSLVQLFRSADNGLSLRELSNLYANAALDSSRDGSGVAHVNPYVQSHAAIAAHLGKQVDLIILATLTVSAVRRMVSALESIDSAKGNGFQNEADVAAFEESRGECFGYVALLCALYTRHAISSQLIYEIVKFVANSLNGVRLEILLFILRQVGAQLRLDDPVGLKDVIEFIYDRFAALRESTPLGSESSSGGNPQDTKLQIMLDLVNDIKNNKLRKSAVKEAQAKFSWACVPDDPLSASINDLRDDDFIKMRWWDDTMGLTVAERRGVATANQTEEDIQVSAPVVVDEGPDLATLASSLRLNTEYRRALFRAIMGSANVKDAFERLENMAAFESKDRHDRDTALVILHCCGSERSFNPFYAVLAEKVCRHSRKLRFTFEFALWDVFKAIPGSVKVAAMARRKRSNYTQLLTYLWMSGAMSMSVLRCVPDFEECGVLEKEFYTDAVAQLMRKLSTEEKDRLAPFEKLAQETWNGVDDFRISFALFLRRSVGPCLTGQERSLQTKALDLLENARTIKS